MLRRSALSVAFALLASALPAGARSAPGEGTRALAEARALLDAGRPADAVALLKAAPADDTDARRTERLLGIAYLKAGNRPWAIRTLSHGVQADPTDCEARVWLAHALMDGAFLDEASLALDRPECSGRDPAGVRWQLSTARLARLRGDAVQAGAALAGARRASEAWSEDRKALAAMSLALPDHLPDLSWRLDLVSGYTTNAWMAALADDPAASGRDGGSPLVQLDGWVRATPDFGAVVRPLAEVQVRALGLLDPDVRELSLFDLGGRAGLVIGTGLPRVTLAYRTDHLLLARGDRYDDAPTWYYGLHRGEAEVEATPWITVFGGAGRRAFREQVRSRIEADLGAGGSIALANPATLLWAVSGRMHRAGHEAWNLWGGSLLAAALVRLPRGFLVRVSASAGLDGYTDSGGEAGESFFGTRDRRLDVSARAGALVWSPSWSGFRVGLGYDFTDRESSAARYAYRDHRVALHLSWNGNAEVVLPAVARDRPAAVLEWGGTGDAAGPDERVQDLLRQDEQVQRSSSCVQ